MCNWIIGKTYKDYGNRTYVVTSVDDKHVTFTRAGYFKVVRNLDGTVPGGCYKEWKVIFVSEEFNISTATDQELADEYRRSRREVTRPLVEEIRKRGYTMYFNGVPFTKPFAPDNKVVIKKTVTETVEL